MIHPSIKVKPLILWFVVLGCTAPAGAGEITFEGRINATLTRGHQIDALLYTVGTNFIRVEMTAANRPNPVDIVDRNTGELTLLFPNNRSFVRLKSDENTPALAGGPPATPNPPVDSSFGPTPVPRQPVLPQMPGAPAPPNQPALPERPPAIPVPMPPAMMPKMDLLDTGIKTNLLGFECEQYEIKQHGETMEIWATGKLFPFEPYMRNQPHRFTPPAIEARWAKLAKEKRLFPLLATLKFNNGAEFFRFEVNSIVMAKINVDDDKLFKPPTNYFETQPQQF
jgi:hypothetical protein